VEADVITRLEGLVQKANAFRHVTDDGREHFSVPLHTLDPPTPEPLVVHTLGALVEYLVQNRDGLDPKTCTVHVKDHLTVEVCSKLRAPYGQRDVFMRAQTANVAASSQMFSFGSFLPVEDMIIALQTLFTDHADRGKVLKLLGSVKDEQVSTQGDDGVSQSVSVKAGISLTEVEEVPNPVYLAPYRTFAEMRQPVSAFVLRARKGQHGGITFALFEAEGAHWKLEAVERIAEYLKGQIGSFGLIA
jgi:hypothetical protein